MAADIKERYRIANPSKYLAYEDQDWIVLIKINLTLI